MCNLCARRYRKISSPRSGGLNELTVISDILTYIHTDGRTYGQSRGRFAPKTDTSRVFTEVSKLTHINKNKRSSEGDVVRAKNVSE